MKLLREIQSENKARDRTLGTKNRNEKRLEMMRRIRNLQEEILKETGQQVKWCREV